MAADPTASLREKVSHVVSLRSSARPSPDALLSLSQFHPAENTVEDRRLLSERAHARTAALHREFLESFKRGLGGADSAGPGSGAEGVSPLDALDSDIGRILGHCDRITECLDAAREASKDVLDRARALRTESAAAEAQLDALRKFEARFRVSPAEAALLRGEWSARPAEDATRASSSPSASPAVAATATSAAGGAQPDAPPAAFYDALERLEAIREDCASVLLRARHQRAGLEIMDEVSALQESAYESLFRWVQQCTAGSLAADEPEAPAPLARAIRALEGRPVLRRCALEEVGSARRTATIRRFVAALTRGANGARPIEMHAHDPLRYVGDMLAWLHQAVALESDLVTRLFGRRQRRQRRRGLAGDDGAQGGGEEGDSAGEGDAPAELDPLSVLDHIFQGVCRPFRGRVEQVVAAQRNAVLAYRLTNLLEFYQGTLASLLGVAGESSSLCDAIAEARAEAARSFETLLENYCERIVRFVPDVPLDLSPPQLVYEAVHSLSQILQVYESSLVGSGAAGTSAEDAEAEARALEEAEAEARALAAAVAAEAADASATTAPSSSPDQGEGEGKKEEGRDEGRDEGGEEGGGGGGGGPKDGDEEGGEQESIEVRQKSAEGEEAPGSDEAGRSGAGGDRDGLRAAEAAAPRVKNPLVELLRASRALVAAITRSVELSGATLSASDLAVYAANAASVVQNALIGRRFCATLAADTVREIEVRVEELVAEQSREILDSCGLGPRRAAIEEYINERAVGTAGLAAAMSASEGLSSDAVARDIRAFYQVMFAGAAGTLVIPQCDRLLNPRLRRTAHSRIASRLVGAYATVFEAVHDPKSGYSDPGSIARHNPDQVLTLVGAEPSSSTASPSLTASNPSA